MRLAQCVVVGLAVEVIDRNIVAPVTKPDASVRRALVAACGPVEVASRKPLERKWSATPNDVLDKSVVSVWNGCADAIGWCHLLASVDPDTDALRGNSRSIR